MRVSNFTGRKEGHKLLKQIELVEIAIIRVKETINLIRSKILEISNTPE